LISWELGFMIFSYKVLLIQCLRSQVWKINTCWYCFFLLNLFSALWFFMFSFLLSYLHLMTWIVGLVGKPELACLLLPELQVCHSNFQFHHFVFNKLKIELHCLSHFTKIFFLSLSVSLLLFLNLIYLL
jgi:hypothetical protein